MSVHIPAGPDEVDAAWMSTATRWRVDTVDIEQIGIGIGVSSAVYRATLTGSDCPNSVIVKLAALAPEAAYTSTALGMYRREVEFFNGLAERCPIRVPAGHYAAINEEGSEFVVVMEDMAGNRVPDQLLGVSLTDAECAIDALADWHIEWWRDIDGLEEQGAAVPLGTPVYPAVLPGLFAEGWSKIEAEAPHCLTGLEDIGARFGDAIAPLLQQLDQSPNTLLHGDFRSDNMMYGPNDELILLDFQITSTGSGAYDLAYFITQSLGAELASEHERTLIDRWTQRIVGSGIDAADVATVWDDYRAAALFCLVYPVVASRGMDLLGDPRQMSLVEVMMSRMKRASDDLNLAELL